MGSGGDWFTITTRLKRAIEIVNGIDSSRFSKLVYRLVLHLQSNSDSCFTPEEEEKLKVALNLGTKELELVLDTSSYFLEQAAYHIGKPGTFSQQLEKLLLDGEKVLAFVEAWTQHGPSVVETLRKRSIAPKQLDSVKWQLNIQMAQANRTKMKVPCGIVELGLNNTATSAKEKLQLEFSHAELYSFFQQLEDIQAQLDSLGK